MQELQSTNEKPQLMTKLGSTSQANARSITNNGSIAVLAVDDKRLIATILPRIFLPNGKPVGRVILEDQLQVWIRRVSLERHLLRLHKAWTINDGVLLQLVDHEIDLIVYNSGAGCYEISLGDFVSQSKVLYGFGPESENVYSLPLTEWQATERQELLPLFTLSAN